MLFDAECKGGVQHSFVGELHLPDQVIKSLRRIFKGAHVLRRYRQEFTGFRVKVQGNERFDETIHDAAVTGVCGIFAYRLLLGIYAGHSVGLMDCGSRQKVNLHYQWR